MALPAAPERAASLMETEQSSHLLIPTTSQTAPRLSVVVVNYCQWANVDRLVRQMHDTQVLRDGVAEIVIVDNHSPADRVVPRLRRWPGVSLRRWGRNRGFARAVNEGWRISRGDWLLLLNPDVTVTDGFLDRVLAHAEQLRQLDPRTGVIGFELRNDDGSLQGSSGPFPTLAGTLARLALPRARRKYHTLRQRSRVPWVSGCCLLVRRDCLEQLGGLDEAFFLYYEDVDLCRRARARGWSIWYEPALAVIHHRPLHQRTVSAPLRLLTRHALLTYAARHWPRWQLWLLAGVVRLEAWVRQRGATAKDDHAAAAVFADLGDLAADFATGREAAARRRLQRLVQREGPHLAG